MSEQKEVKKKGIKLFWKIARFLMLFYIAFAVFGALISGAFAFNGLGGYLYLSLWLLLGGIIIYFEVKS